MSYLVNENEKHEAVQSFYYTKLTKCTDGSRAVVV